MALTESTMLELGAPAPDFALPDVTSGKTVSLSEATREKGVLVMFICSHCPFVVHINAALGQLGRDYANQPVGIVAICSNDPVSHPKDAPENLRKQVAEQGFTFPYLVDETQEVAKAYRAACTPDLYLFDANKKLVYRGQFDSSRPGNDVPVTGKDLRAALDALIAGKPISDQQTASIGCNIKWRPGNEPAYSG
ncbi:MAG: redoxin domain-containing protein [Acidobacteria bacterium]|nr:redoxin domain-containing protein [Acidobacteriota bacterium]